MRNIFLRSPTEQLPFQKALMGWCTISLRGDEVDTAAADAAAAVVLVVLVAVVPVPVSAG